MAVVTTDAQEAYAMRALRAYVEALLWTSTDDDGEPLDATHDHWDVCGPSMPAVVQDVKDFVVANWADLADMDPEQAGHDFLLTRNRHGAGFWDRGLGDRGDRLTVAAHAYGETDAYVGDDGRVWVS